MNKNRVFHAQDWWTALIAALISFALYAYTAAPSVTLLDSGEFLVAAQHFGVPHPTGYPLWTLLNWLFSLLPLGNASWQIALCSGVCAALAVGVCALLSSRIIWGMGFLPETGPGRWLRPCIVLSFSLLLAFSVSMWSQAVIAEVYALHALLIGIYLTLLYVWTCKPNRDRYMLGAFFVLALAFSNHHLTLVLSPLPFLLIVLLRRRAFWDWMLAALLTVLLGYLSFAILSKDILVLRTALRFAYCVGAIFIIFLWLRRMRIRWRLIAFLPFTIFLGLLPYMYMPLASSTNPPMNWGYTREPEGFYFSINRSQYAGSLAEQSVRTLGRLMGTFPAQAKSEDQSKKDKGGMSEFQLWAGFFWGRLLQSFTPLCIIAYFASFFAAFRLPLAGRTWIYMLHISFVLAAFLQPVMDDARIDMAGWWLQMPYHTYTNLIFAVLCSVGLAFIMSLLLTRFLWSRWLGPILLALPLITLNTNWAECSQRNRWFGWMFGYDMLKDLPPGSVMIGGTDPGRFVPTYMIFGESSQDDRLKREPFKRSDLYIITQNALGESTYMKYLRDHYTTSRPAPKNAFEHWLGRDKTYPEKPLIFPTPEENNEIMAKAREEARKPDSGLDEDLATFGGVFKWIWERNRDQHDFFVEESFPIKWTYDYAIPHGLIYQLSKTKLDRIPPEAVERDFAFWKDYSARLLSDPEYMKDYDAQRSFSKLRQTMGNIYRYRKMDAEAEKAYREALELWPENGEVLVALVPYLWDKGQFAEAVKLFDRALEKDYNNVDLWRLRLLAERRGEAEGLIQAAKSRLERQPKSRDIITQLIQLYSQVGEGDKADEMVERASRELADDADMQRIVIDYYTQNNDLAKTLEPAHKLTKLESTNAQNYILLARAYFSQDKKKEFYETARKAIEIGGLPTREELLNDPAFTPWRQDPEFRALESPVQTSATEPASSSTGGHEQKTLRSP